MKRFNGFPNAHMFYLNQSKISCWEKQIKREVFKSFRENVRLQAEIKSEISVVKSGKNTGPLICFQMFFLCQLASVNNIRIHSLW